MNTTNAINENVELGLQYIFIQWVMFVVGIIGILFVLYFVIFKHSQFSLSVRNVFRNKRRSLITLLAVTAAVSGNILVGTYFLQMFLGLRESTIRSQTGHLQYMKTDYYEKGASAPTEYLIENADEIVDILKANKDFMQYVDIITTQARFNGLITAGDKSISFIGNAVESDKDASFASIDVYVDGSPLDVDTPYEIVIGEGVATQLGVTVEDSVVLLSSISGGGLNALDATVRGIIRPFAKEYSDVVVKTDLQFAKEILYSQGANKILVLLNDTKDTDVARTIMANIMKQHPEWDVKLYDWYDLQDFYRQVVTFFSSIFTVVSALLFFLVIFLVLNTMTMSVFERFNEFGTLRSIGVKKRQLVNMVVIEGVILGFIGAIVGIVVAQVVGSLITQMDFEVTAPPGQSQGYPLILTPLYDFATVKLIIISCLASIGMAFISSLFPALKGAKLKIVDALRFN